MQDISKKMNTIAKSLEASFSLKGRAITLNEVFADTGLLPGLAKRADQLASLCFGYGLGAKFQDEEN